MQERALRGAVAVVGGEGQNLKPGLESGGRHQRIETGRKVSRNIPGVMRRDTDGVRSLVHRWQPEPLPLLWRGWLLSKCECSDTHQRDGCTETPPIRSPVPRTCRRRSRGRWERADAVDGLTLKERKPSRNRVQNPGPDFSQFTLQENKIQAGQNPTTYSKHHLSITFKIVTS